MDLNRIEAILRLLQQQEHVGDLSVEGEGWRLRARRGVLPLAPRVTEATVSEELPPPVQHSVQAGAVGLYRAPSAPLRAGDYVDSGKILGSIDSMGIRNPVAAPEGGYLSEILVEDGDPVEYGQVLAVLSPEPPDADGSDE